MPPRPDILDRIRKEGLAEVFGQCQAQHLTDAENDVRIAGEIRVELHCKQHRPQQKLGAVIGGGVRKHRIHHNRGTVSHRQLFEVPPCAALHTAPDAGGVPSCRAIHLGHQLVIAVEGSLRDREKKRGIAQQPRIPFFRQKLAAAHITEIAYKLQRKVADAQRIGQLALPPEGRRQIFEQQQRKKRSRQPCIKSALRGRSAPAPPDQKGAGQQYRQCLPAQHSIKDKVSPQHQLPAARRRAGIPKPRQQRCKQHKAG